MQVTKASFPTLTARRLVFGAFLPVELSRAELESQGKKVILSVWEKVSADFKPPPDTERDNDGDWAITWESGRRQFSLNLQKNVVGAKFAIWPDPMSAAKLIRTHASEAFEKLAIRKLSTLMMKYGTVFLLPQDINNHERILPKLLGSWGDASGLATVIKEIGLVGRFDMTFSYELDDYHHAFVQVELPANRDKRTVWFELVVKTRDDITVDIGEGQDGGSQYGLSTFLDAANTFYREDYASFVSHVLDDLDVALLGSDD